MTAPPAGLVRPADLRERLMLLLAGRAAEQEVFGTASSGAGGSAGSPGRTVNSQMLLYRSSGQCCWCGSFGHPAKMTENLTIHEAFEAASDLWLALSLRNPTFCVVDCGLMISQTYNDDTIERSVGLAVATAVQSMPGPFAARGWDRTYAA